MTVYVERALPDEQWEAHDDSRMLQVWLQRLSGYYLVSATHPDFTLVRSAKSIEELRGTSQLSFCTAAGIRRDHFDPRITARNFEHLCSDPSMRREVTAAVNSLPYGASQLQQVLLLQQLDSIFGDIPMANLACCLHHGYPRYADKAFEEFIQVMKGMPDGDSSL